MTAPNLKDRTMLNVNNKLIIAVLSLIIVAVVSLPELLMNGRGQPYERR